MVTIFYRFILSHAYVQSNLPIYTRLVYRSDVTGHEWVIPKLLLGVLC